MMGAHSEYEISKGNTVFIEFIFFVATQVLRCGHRQQRTLGHDLDECISEQFHDAGWYPG